MGESQLKGRFRDMARFQHVGLISESEHDFLFYQCTNCSGSLKTFAVRLSVKKTPGALITKGFAQKYGETPAFGPPTPGRVLKLMGDDRSLYLLGRRCENQAIPSRTRSRCRR